MTTTPAPAEPREQGELLQFAPQAVGGILSAQELNNLYVAEHKYATEAYVYPISGDLRLTYRR